MQPLVPLRAWETKIKPLLSDSGATDVHPHPCAPQAHGLWVGRARFLALGLRAERRGQAWPARIPGLNLLLCKMSPGSLRVQQFQRADQPAPGLGKAPLVQGPQATLRCEALALVPRQARFLGGLQLPPFHLVGSGGIPIRRGAQFSFHYCQVRGSDPDPALGGFPVCPQVTRSYSATFLPSLAGVHTDLAVPVSFHNPFPQCLPMCDFFKGHV